MSPRRLAKGEVEMPDDLLIQQMNKIDSRCDDLDRRMRRFETFAVAAGMVAVLLGIGAGVGSHIIAGFSSRLNGYEDRLNKAQPTLDNLSRDEERIENLSKSLDGAADKFDSSASSAALLDRIKAFESESPPQPYAWVGYYSDFQNLRNFAVEYVTLVAVDPQQGSALEETYRELLVAAETVKTRAQVGLRAADVPKWYEMHWKQSPQNFENLLVQFRGDQAGRLDGALVGCYQVAFPNWLANNGAFVNEIGRGANSSDCLKRLRISY
jgi:hypothetical protein